VAHSFANVGEGTLQMNKTDDGNHTGLPSMPETSFIYIRKMIINFE
jgi:hypothetical protein